MTFMATMMTKTMVTKIILTMHNVQCTYIRSFSLLNLEQNTSYSFLMTCSDRQDNFWTSEKIKFDTGVFVYQ